MKDGVEFDTVVVFGEALTVNERNDSFRSIRESGSMSMEGESTTVPPTPNSTTFLIAAFDPPTPPSPLSLQLDRHQNPSDPSTSQSTGRKLLARLSLLVGSTKGPFEPTSSSDPIPIAPSLDTAVTPTTPHLDMQIQPFRFSVDREFRKLDLHHRKSSPAPAPSFRDIPVPILLPTPSIDRSNDVGREATATPGSRYSTDTALDTEEEEADFISRYMSAGDPDTSDLDEVETMEDVGLESRLGATNKASLDDAGRQLDSTHRLILRDPHLRRRSSTSSDSFAGRVELKLGWGKARAQSMSSDGYSMLRGRGREGSGVSSVFSSDSSASIQSFRLKSVSKPLSSITER